MLIFKILMKNGLLLSITLFILAGYSTAYAETNPEEGEWNLFVLNAKIKNKFSFTGEFNFRSEKMILPFNYCEYKGSVSYSLSKNVAFLVGAGKFRNGMDDVLFSNNNVQTEFRTWVDLLWIKHSLGRFNFEHKGRLEQRFLPSNYQNRFRYRLLLNLPLNHPQIIDNTLFICTYDEIFIGENDPMWETNKFSASAGYKVNEKLSFQLGNILMTNFRKESTIGKNYLALMITYNI